ncbi:MAG: DUF3488 and transglutaminase-like domain-containing protein [Alcanivorax sp.]|nr:DUF3488 and transglutaminase-like domain-containing protein [Alcanivorax sp.]
MARVYQLPNHTRVWLTLAVMLCSLPQLLRGPLWQFGLLAVVVVVRGLVQRQWLALPGKISRTLMLLVTVGLTFYSFGRLYGPEAGVALLVSLFALKYLEVVRQRDAYVLIVLGYFVCATSLLFYQGILMFAYVLTCAVLLTACLIGINYTDTRARSVQHLRVALVMLMQALPLMVVLFILVPRVAPLWDMGLGHTQARTGMTDSMSPGQISNLSRSSEVAFRVAFAGQPPPPSQRYWRGLTLSRFDGRTWSQALPAGMRRDDFVYSGAGRPPGWYRQWQQVAASDAPRYRYRVLMEPSQQPWLYALTVPLVKEPGIGMAQDFRLIARDPVTQRIDYRVESVPAIRYQARLGPAERALMLSLPARGGARARSLAQSWRLESDGGRQIVLRALQYFREQPFYYTLSPPRLDQDTIDDFLFRSRRGFCEHYASSFTFLMRAAGIPARVVVGYQGGEINPHDGHLLVRQYDAHAWSEVWLAGKGWVRVDPTAAVAPERIEDGLQAALDAQDNNDVFGGEAAGFAGDGWLGKLAAWKDYVDFRWQSWVLGYDAGQQLTLLSGFLGTVTPLRVALALLGGLSVPLLLFMVWMLWQYQKRPLTALEREFYRLFERVQRDGVLLSAGTSPAQLADHIAMRWPKAAALARHWQNTFQQLAYQDRPLNRKTGLRHLRRLRRRLVRLLV